MNGSNRTGLVDNGLSVSGASTKTHDPSTSIVLNGKQGAPPKRGAKTLKKASVAPKRFKSSFIFFSMAKHKGIKEQLAKDGKTTKNMNVTKMVSDAWRSICPEEKAKYDAMAKEDKERYEREKAAYTAPPGASKKKKRDPTAPRRPMSAFLAFANSRRGKVKAANMENSNGEISKILSTMWKEEREEKKQRYRDEEVALWTKYKAAMEVWRKEKDKKQEEAMERQSKIDELERAEGNEPKKTSSGLAGLAGNGSSNNPSHANDLLRSSNQDEISMAVSALRGVRGGSTLPMGLGIQQTQATDLLAYVELLRNRRNPYSAGLGLSGSGLGSSLGFPYELGNPASRALLGLGLPSQQLTGLPLGNMQSLLMAQAMGGTPSSYHNPLLGLTGAGQQSSLSQLATLMGTQNNSDRAPGPGADDLSTDK